MGFIKHAAKMCLETWLWKDFRYPPVRLIAPFQAPAIGRQKFSALPCSQQRCPKVLENKRWWEHLIRNRSGRFVLDQKGRKGNTDRTGRFFKIISRAWKRKCALGHVSISFFLCWVLACSWGSYLFWVDKSLDIQIPPQKVFLMAYFGGSSHTEPQQVALDVQGKKGSSSPKPSVRWKYSVKVSKHQGIILHLHQKKGPWKIFSSNWIISPRVGVKIPKKGQNHHLAVMAINHWFPLIVPYCWWLKSCTSW